MISIPHRRDLPDTHPANRPLHELATIGHNMVQPQALTEPEPWDFVWWPVALCHWTEPWGSNAVWARGKLRRKYCPVRFIKEAVL